MTVGPEAQPVASAAPRERGWRRIVLGLVLATGCTAIAIWPPSLAPVQVAARWLLPVPSVLSLLFGGLVACAIAGWARGGRPLTALTAASMLGLWLVRHPAGDLLDRVQMGWALLVTACFGWWVMDEHGRPFLDRALPAVGAAGVVAVLVLGSAPAGSDLAAVGRRIDERFLRQRDASVAVWRVRLEESDWAAVTQRAPSVRRLADRVAVGMASLAPPTPVVPALIVLETLAVLALAWGTWHRVSRVRLGPPLAALAEFRFHDQLVWGVVAGAALMLVPSLDGWRVVGMNLVVVFGALHAVRGLGVLVWWLPERWWAAVLLVLVAGIPLLGPVLVLAIVAVLALGLGLGDTWRDFRRTTRSWRAASRP